VITSVPWQKIYPEPSSRWQNNNSISIKDDKFTNSTFLLVRDNASKSSAAEIAGARIGSSVDIRILLDSGNLEGFKIALHLSNSNLDQRYHLCQKCSLFRVALYLRKISIAKWLFDSGCSIFNDTSCDIHASSLSEIHLVMGSNALSNELLVPLLARGYHYTWQNSLITPLHVAAYVNNTLGISMFLNYFSKHSAINESSVNRRPGRDQRRGEDMTNYAEASKVFSHAFLKLPFDVPVLQFAAANGNEAAVSMLLKFGANPNATNPSIPTALFSACEKQHVSVVNLLLKSGANPNIPDSFGKTCFMAAAKVGHEAILESLVKYGADVSAVNVKNDSALCYSANPSIMAYMVRKGCKTGLNIEHMLDGVDILDYFPMLCNTGLQILASESISKVRLLVETFKVIWKLIMTGVWDCNASKVAASQLLDGAVDETMDKMEYILDECAKQGINAYPHGEPLLKSCSYGRLNSVKLLFRRTRMSTWPDWETISEAIVHSRHHPNLQLWFLVGRFTEQKKIGLVEDNKLKEQVIKPWSGVQRIPIHLVGNYAQHEESRQSYACRIYQTDKQDMLEYCQAAAMEMASRETQTRAYHT
jgi:ankyrin repeat protein